MFNVKVEQRIKDLATEIGFEILSGIFGTPSPSKTPKPKQTSKRNMSAEGRAAISRAQQERWAKYHAKQSAKPERQATPTQMKALRKAWKARRANAKARKEKAA